MSERVEQEVLIAAPIERVFQVVTDYERYPQFLPEMKDAKVLSSSGTDTIVHFELEILMRIGYTLRLTHEAPRRVTWRLEEAKMLAENNGGWELTPEGSNTRARYFIELKLRGLIPKSVSTRLAETTLPQTLERFKRRAESA